MDEIQTPEVTPEAEPLPPVLEDVPVAAPAEEPPVETVAEMVCPQPEGPALSFELWRACVDLVVVVIAVQVYKLMKK